MNLCGIFLVNLSTKSSQWCVVILRSVMDHQFTLGEEETIGFYFPRCSRYFSFFFLAKLREIIHELPRVSAVGNHKAKFKRVVADHLASKVVSLNHFHVLDWLLSYAKIHGETNSLKIKKIWSQVILDHSFRRVIIVTELFIIDFIIRNFY